MRRLAKSQPTKRALDAGDSAAFSSIFLASSFLYSQTESTPAPAPVTQTVGRRQEKSLVATHSSLLQAPGSMDKRGRISLERIEHATSVISSEFLNTPQFECEPLSAELGARVVVKVETINPIRSFKGRGAELYMSKIPAGAEVVCASAGNFGQAMAYAARRHGVRVSVYAATNANPLKLDRMKSLGANVRLVVRSQHILHKICWRADHKNVVRTSCTATVSHAVA